MYIPPSGRIQTSFGPLSSFPSRSLTSTVTCLDEEIDHSWFCSSAQAIRSPLRSNHMPFDLPHGFIHSETEPSTLHFMIRSLGWSVKNTFPERSVAGPS